MVKFDPMMEGRMADAIRFYHENPHLKKTKVATQFLVSYNQFRARLQGRAAQNSKGGHNKRLGEIQEASLMDYVKYLIDLKQYPTISQVWSAAQFILARSGDHGKPISLAWAKRWLERQKHSIKTLKSKTLASERKEMHDEDVFKTHFEGFQYAKGKFGILDEDIWNFDETCFRIAVLTGRVVICDVNTKAVYLSDPDQRESLTSIECINGGGGTIPPMLILTGSILLQKHFQNDLEADTLIGINKTGYSNSNMSMEWIRHFNKFSKTQTKGKYRMLVFDGHGSHLTDDFLYYCWAHDIVPFQLPPKTTHLLQPLDLGVFQPLKHWHQVSLHEALQFGNTEFTKQDFLNAYQTVRNRTFKRTTVLSAWKKSGLIPFNPSLVLSKMAEFEGGKKPEPEEPKTPQKPRHLPDPLMRTPTTAQRYKHRAILTMALYDHIQLGEPLPDNYLPALVKFLGSSERKVLHGSLVEERERRRVASEAHKKAIKAQSGKHIQKNGVLYKWRGEKESMEANKEEEEYRASIWNKKLEATIRKTDAAYKKWVKQLPIEYPKWIAKHRSPGMGPIYIELGCKI